LELDHDLFWSGASCLLDSEEISSGTDCLGAISLLEFSVFVIFTFFKEGIGNILNHAIYGVLGSWNLELGTWGR
jgi:hypothetical protein